MLENLSYSKAIKYCINALFVLVLLNQLDEQRKNVWYN